MSVKVADILHLDILNDAEVVSGKDGLEKTVKRVASIERPFAEHAEYSYKVAQPGDIYVSKLYVFEDSVEKIYAELEFQNKTGACGLITQKEMLGRLDDHVMELSDRYHLPIIAISNDVGLTELAFSITDLIIKDRAMQINVRFFENMLQNELNPEDIKKNITSLDWDLQNIIQCIFIKTDGGLNVNQIKTEKGDNVLPIYDGAVYIITGESETEVTNRISGYIDGIKRTRDTFNIGIGTVNRGLENMKKAVFEAICANAYSMRTEKSIVRYDSLGVFAILAELKDNSRLREYRDNIYSKIKEVDHDEKLESERMVELFVLTGGIFKFVSDRMFTHEATIRYRMNKIRDHLDFGNMTEMFTELKVAVYASWILDDENLQRLR